MRKQPVRAGKAAADDGQISASAKRALIKQVVLESVPISIPADVQRSRTTLDECTALIEAWASVEGIRSYEVDAASRLVQAVRQAGGGRPRSRYDLAVVTRAVFGVLEFDI